MESLPQHNKIGGISGALEHRFDPQTGTVGSVLPQLWHRSQLQLKSDPWPGNFACHGRGGGEPEKEKKNKKKLEWDLVTEKQEIRQEKSHPQTERKKRWKGRKRNLEQMGLRDCTGVE